MALFDVTTELLLGTKTNLVANASSEVTASFASNLFGCTAARSTNAAWSGVASTLVTCTSAGTIGASTPTGTAGAPVTAGTQYVARFMVRSSAGNAAGRQTQIRVDWYDAAGALLSMSTTTNEQVAWTTFEIADLTVTAPPGAAFGAIRALVANVLLNEQFYLDAALIQDVDTYDGSFFEGTVPDWRDISSDVRQADGVQITRGRADEASRADPSSCTLTLNNRDGKYSPRNPVSPYYGKIGRNTQLRITAEGSSRFYGEVSAWPQRWDKTGRDIYVPLQASGVTRRLGQGVAPLRSVMYRGVTALDTVVAYWPCEDGESATEFASGLPDHPPMYPRGTVEMASHDGFKASDPLPTAGGVRWIGSVPAYTVTGKTQFNFLMYVPPGGASFTKTVARLRTTGTAPRWDVDLTPAGSLVLRAFDVDDVVLFSSGVAFAVNGQHMRVTVELEQVGTSVEWSLGALFVGDLFGTSDGGTLASRTVGRVARVGMNVGGSDLTGTVLGHIAVKDALGPDTAIAGLELRAYEGETAGARLQRLCAEEGVTLTIGAASTVSETVAMGPQLPGSLLDLLDECASADMGILFESRDLLGLYYRTRASLYAQSADLTLDYTAGAVSGIEPTEDDDAIRNDITVTRVNGSSARAQLETGPLSVNAPPDGVGRYDDEVTVSVERDEDLPDQASWRLHVGTVDEARYPVIGVNLAGSAFRADALLTADALDLDAGDRIVVTNAPSGSTSPDDIQQLAQGFTESLGQYEWLIDVNCTPASPWDVAVWDDTSGPGEARYSSDGTVLNEALDTTETNIDVHTPTGPVWSNDDAETPFDIVIGGERMTVTDVVGTSAFQVFTVTRSVNGVVKTHTSGADVALYKPAIYAL